MKKTDFSGFIAILLCISLLSGCGSSAKEDFSAADWLGQDLNECLEKQDITPGEDLLLLADANGVVDYLLLAEQAEYLGETFFVEISCPTGTDESLFYTNKVDSVTFIKDFYQLPDETAAKKAAEIFAAMQEEYGSSGTMSLYQGSGAVISNAGGPELLTEEKIAEAIAAFRDAGSEQTIPYLILCEWELPDEYAKIDAVFVEKMEQLNGFERTCTAVFSLEYSEGRFFFSIRHSFGRPKNAR